MCSLEQTSHMASGLVQDLGRRCPPRGSAAPGYRPCHTSAGSHQPPLLQILSPAGIWGVLCSGGQDSRIYHHLSRGIMIFLPHWDTAENRRITLGWQELTGLCTGSCMFALLVLVREGLFSVGSRAVHTQPGCREDVSFHLPAAWRGECIFPGPQGRKPRQSRRGEAFLLLVLVSANPPHQCPASREMYSSLGLN